MIAGASYLQRHGTSYRTLDGEQIIQAFPPDGQRAELFFCADRDSIYGEDVSQRIQAMASGSQKQHR